MRIGVCSWPRQTEFDARGAGQELDFRMPGQATLSRQRTDALAGLVCGAAEARAN
jgi:hypothetical protein